MLVAEGQKGVLLFGGFHYSILNILKTSYENLTHEIHISFPRNFFNVSYLRNQLPQESGYKFIANNNS